MEFSADITALEPTLEETLLMGQALLQSRQLDAALEEFQTALQKAPELAHVHLVIGKIYSRKHEYQQAEASFSSAARLDPLSAQPLLALARLHLHRGELELAAEEFNAALAIDTKSDMALVGLGRVALQRGQLEEAERHLQQALELVPDLIDAKMPLAEVYRKARRWDDAIKILEHVPLGSPQAPMIKMKQADLLLSCHRYEEASDVLERMRADYPLIIGTPGPAQLDLITTMLATGKTADAIETDTTTIDFRELASRQQRLKGVMHARAKRDQEALRSLIGAWQINRLIAQEDTDEREHRSDTSAPDVLREALANKEFQVHYKPMIALKSGKVVGWDQCLRWRDEISMKLSEHDMSTWMAKTGLSQPLGIWLMIEGCRHLLSTQMREGFVGLELTEQQLRDPSLCEQLALVSGAFGLPASVLLATIDATVLAQLGTRWRDIQAQMTRLSIKIAITADSNQSQAIPGLEQPTSRMERHPCASLLQQGSESMQAENVRAMGVQIVADGIKTTEEVSRLLGLGVEYGTGPMYSKYEPS